MKRMGLYALAVLLLGLMVAAMPVGAASRAPALVVDGRAVAPAEPLRWDGGTVLVSLENLAVDLQAAFQRDEAAGTAFIQKYGRTLLFRLDTQEVRRNSLPVTAPAAARVIDGKVYAPLRFVAENLAATVVWDGRGDRIEIITGERRTPPERVGEQRFNAVLAYTDQGNLWLLDGRKSDNPPEQVTDTGQVEIVGWSPDGAWLAYKHASVLNAPAYLWVVRADGSGAAQVDARPIYDDVLWSPRGNCLVYTTSSHSPAGNVPAVAVRWADLSTGAIQVETLLEDGPVITASLAWHPDGERVTVSMPRSGDKPPMLEQVSLTGERDVIHIYEDKAPVDPEGLYPWAFTGLKWSPEGRYLAYHLSMNSASLSADSVAVGMLDTDTGRVTGLSDGLGYREWPAFSPDGAGLAYIAGVGRDVNLNKRVGMVDTADGRVGDYGQGGYVDSHPVWLPGEPGALLFCRGPEARTLDTAEIFPGVMVPDQRIYKLNPVDENGAAALTAGPADTADYYPNPSPSGTEMIFLRLHRFNQGSLYVQPLDAPEQAVEILRGLRGEPGYYGNYLPAWVAVHWFSEQE